MSQTIKDKALEALDGLIDITRNEMLVHGEYVTGIVDEKLHSGGSICDGRAACLLGGLALRRSASGGGRPQLALADVLAEVAYQTRRECP